MIAIRDKLSGDSYYGVSTFGWSSGYFLAGHGPRCSFVRYGVSPCRAGYDQRSLGSLSSVLCRGVAMKHDHQPSSPASGIWLFIFDIVAFAFGAVVVLVIFQHLGLTFLR